VTLYLLIKAGVWAAITVAVSGITLTERPLSGSSATMLNDRLWAQSRHSASHAALCQAPTPFPLPAAGLAKTKIQRS
jgi:hypothetical protein